MLRAVIPKQGQSFAHDLPMRGYAALYRDGQVNHCPGCGRSHWHIGRVLAECGFCATALPLQDASTRGAAAVHTRNNRPVFPKHLPG